MGQGKHALIFGASGVTGWSFVNEMLNDYPQPQIWNRVSALTNRPLTREAAMWPADERLDIVSGIDLLKGSQDELEEVMRSKIPQVNSVTHVYYFAYKANHDLHKELQDAVDMFRRAITAIDHLSSGLEFVVLQTGAKVAKTLSEIDSG
ncbi:hypothetical protein LTR16_000510 [Cryomyces antarcticus]|uniref:PRISE-like Rossmann-fold domain-containing protein n=1 Tax=Cryomyces antarcticus TaxID=329879 RepID=A0ABR0LSE7_9PEZI|nr:hypothetical protein LTR39_000350 [Cryomyces antarcticus]KAK5020911.1 hypothetical protein LTR60_000186 [Cryomyces antarcticus]KAK5202056.1 hypothetical protein LTR16_000510 [Cryomyces antarcticus]